MNAADILQSASLIIAALSIIFGVNAWRREYVGKRRIELAEEVLALFYEARDAVRHIRSPLGFSGEGSTRKQGEHETPEEKHIYDQAYVVFERYNTHKELFNRIKAMRYRFMAQFGKDSSKPFDELNKIINELFAASDSLVHYWLDQGRRQWKNEDEFKAHLTKMHEHEAVFWEMSADKDKITPRLDKLISDIENHCRTIIERKTIYQRIWSRIKPKGKGTPPKKVRESPSKELRVKRNREWQIVLWPIFSAIGLTGAVLYQLALYKMNSFQPFELATVVGIIGGFPLIASFTATDKMDEELKRKLRAIGVLFLFAAICFVIFGFYQAADQAELLEAGSNGYRIMTGVYVVTFYAGAISFISGLWKTLWIIPELVEFNGFKEILRKLFKKGK